jgi:hypothetical protein
MISFKSFNGLYFFFQHLTEAIFSQLTTFFSLFITIDITSFITSCTFSKVLIGVYEGFKGKEKEEVHFCLAGPET